jgi:hypothetical protein
LTFVNGSTIVDDDRLVVVGDGADDRSEFIRTSWPSMGARGLGRFKGMTSPNCADLVVVSSVGDCVGTNIEVVFLLLLLFSIRPHRGSLVGSSSSEGELYMLVVMVMAAMELPECFRTPVNIRGTVDREAVVVRGL